MTLKKLTEKAKPAMGKHSIMALSFGVLNLADYMTTSKILKGGGEELNPIANFLMKRNLWGITKIVATTMGMHSIYKDKDISVFSKAMVGLYGIMVAHNLKEIVRHAKYSKKTIG